jgi:hypothetical protein
MGNESSLPGLIARQSQHIFCTFCGGGKFRGWVWHGAARMFANIVKIEKNLPFGRVPYRKLLSGNQSVTRVAQGGKQLAVGASRLPRPFPSTAYPADSPASHN